MDAPPPSPAPPRRRILLHACCGPCSTHCVRELRASGVEPVLFYSNSNIDTEEEFAKRLAALRAFAAAEGVEVVADAYDPASWERAVAGLEAEPEGGARCTECFALRLGRLALLLGAMLAGLYGLGLAGCVLLLHLSELESFGTPYLSPSPSARPPLLPGLRKLLRRGKTP